MMIDVYYIVRLIVAVDNTNTLSNSGAAPAVAAVVAVVVVAAETCDDIAPDQTNQHHPHHYPNLIYYPDYSHGYDTLHYF